MVKKVKKEELIAVESSSEAESEQGEEELEDLEEDEVDQQQDDGFEKAGASASDDEKDD